MDILSTCSTLVCIIQTVPPWQSLIPSYPSLSRFIQWSSIQIIIQSYKYCCNCIQKGCKIIDLNLWSCHHTYAFKFQLISQLLLYMVSVSSDYSGMMETYNCLNFTNLFYVNSMSQLSVATSCTISNWYVVLYVFALIPVTELYDLSLLWPSK